MSVGPGSQDSAPQWRRWAERLGHAGLVLCAASVLFVVAAALWNVPPAYALGAILCLVLIAAAVPKPPITAAQEPGADGSPGHDAGASSSAILEAVPEPGFLLDGAGTVLQANTRAATLFPATRRGDLFVSTFRSPETAEALSEAQGGLPRSVQFHVPGEASMEYSVSFAPLRLAASREDLVLVFVRDVSDRVAIARMRADFVANASHELRTPLASLTGFIETLLGPARNDPEASARFLRIMLEQAQRMRRLIDDLLSLSRVEMRSGPPPAQAVDLRGVLRSVVDALAPLARDNNVTLEIAAAPAPLQVIGERDELVQVFQNLVENAIRYGASGGRVEIGEASPDAAAGRIAVEVRDYGPGIAEEHLPRLTERFYRVDVGASREMKGTGLGLAIVKHILLRHKGGLTIHSRPGEGARFIVDLPRAGP